MIATMSERSAAGFSDDPMRVIPETTGSRRPSTYHWEYQPIKDLLSQVKNVYRVRAFERDLRLNDEDREWKELLNNVREGAEVVYAVDDEKGEDLATFIHRRETRTIGARSLTLDMIALRVVHEHARRLGIARGFIQDTIRRAEEAGEPLDGFTGRTPNPLIIKGYQHTKEIGLILPVHRLYPQSAREFMIAFLAPDMQGIDPRTGRCIGVYPPGENRLFDPIDPLEDPEGYAIYLRMTNLEQAGGLGIDLAAGDGMRYAAFLNNRLRGRRRWEANPTGLYLPTA